MNIFSCTGSKNNLSSLEYGRTPYGL